MQTLLKKTAIKISSFILAGTSLCLISSCGGNTGSNSIPADPRDSVKENALQLHWHRKGTGGPVTAGLIAKIRFACFSPSDSLIFNVQDIKSPLFMSINAPSDSCKCTTEDALAQLHEGDSVRFFADAQKFYAHNRREALPTFLKEGDKLRFELAVDSVYTQEAFNKKNAKAIKAAEVKNKDLLGEFMASQFPEAKTLPNGLIYFDKKIGKGKSPQNGQFVSLHYSIFFVDGTLFTSSVPSNHPFVFRLGGNQALPGMEAAVSKMKKGGIAVAGLPHELAYGKEGISGKIPPYTSLIIQMELIDIFDELPKIEASSSKQSN